MTNRALLTFYLSTIPIVILYLTHIIPRGHMIEYVWGWQFQFTIGIIESIVLSWLHFLMVLSILLLYKFYKRALGLKKKHTRDILLGLFLLEVFNIVNSILILTTKNTIPSSVQFAFFIACCFLGWGVWKNKLFRLNPMLVASTIINNMSNFLIIMDKNGIIIDINPTLEKLLCFRKEDIIGQRFDKLVYHDNTSTSKANLLLSCDDLIKTRSGGTIEAFIKTNSGKLPVLLTVSPINLNNKVEGYLCIGTDLTLRREIEKLQQKEASLEELNLILNRVITTISHEFRTPLTSIQLAVSNIIKYRDKLTNGQLEEIYRMIANNTAHLEKMINNLIIFEELNVEKIIDLDKLEKYQPSTIIRQNLAFLNPIIVKKQIQITVEVSDDIILSGDRFKINQIFYRILENAVIYSDNKARIEIKAYDNYQGDKNPLNLPGVLFTIYNEGIRLDHSTLEKIFTPFYRSSKVENIPGLGLGLAITRELTKFHQGTVSIEPLEQGVIVFLFLPYLENFQSNQVE